MATHKDTIEFICKKLRNPQRFSARAMFGEYALYADGKVVGLVCDDLLYVKIMPASAVLSDLCEQGAPYPGATPHYIVDEEQLSTIEELPEILHAIAESLPAKKTLLKHHNAHTTQLSTFIPPVAVAQAAARGLALRAQFRRGGTSVGLARAEQLSKRQPVSARDIRHIYSYFARHEIDKSAKDFNNLTRPSNGRIAWLLWGGDPGKVWASQMRDRILRRERR